MDLPARIDEPDERYRRPFETADFPGAFFHALTLTLTHALI